MNAIESIVCSNSITDKEKIEMLAEFARIQQTHIHSLREHISKQHSDRSWEIAGIYGQQGGA